MDTYSAFARVYDRLMENVPYKEWADKLDKWIREYGITKPFCRAKDALESERNLVLDMGCGTGIMTRLMHDKGYDMIGLDISPQMLDEARGWQKDDDFGDASDAGTKMSEIKCVQENFDFGMSDKEDLSVQEDSEHVTGAGDDILYICQDMCELDLYSTVGSVISTCDSINYLLEDEEILSCFNGVAKFLYPGGLFIFDYNTLHKYRDIIGENVIAENTDEVSFIWENFFDEKSHVNECDLTLFVRRDDDLFAKEEEIHYQRGFEIEEIRDFLAKAGLEVLVEEGDCEKLEDAERVFVVARKAKNAIHSMI